LDALDGDPAAARAALHVVRAAARQAGPELRAAVSPLRTDSGEGTVRPPTPRLDDLAELLTPARAAGLSASLVLKPGDEPLPQPAELTAYRIVQESLTNVLRHAQATRVEVAVTREADNLLVSVRDNGSAVVHSGPSAGLGLVGMRERAQLLGGTIEAG